MTEQELLDENKKLKEENKKLVDDAMKSNIRCIDQTFDAIYAKMECDQLINNRTRDIVVSMFAGAGSLLAGVFVGKLIGKFVVTHFINK